MNNLTIQINRFLKRKEVINILGKNYILSNAQQTRLENVFKKYKTTKNIENMLKSLAIMVKNDLTNYTGRISRLVGIPGTTRYTQLLRYGKDEYIKIYKEQSVKKTKHFKNIIDYWKNLGYSDEESIQLVKSIQLERTKKAVLKTKGVSLYSCRSKEYWLSIGYSDDEAIKKVNNIQITNGIDFYKRKYPNDYNEKFLQRINNWKNTLYSNKNYTELCKKRGHSINAGISRGLSLEEATNNYKRIVEHLQSIKKNSSNISQKLFDMLSENLNGETYYNTKNYEYLIEGYRVDFYNKDKKIVLEFYGDFFHRNPNKYDPLYTSMGYTSVKKWEYDKKREYIIKNSKNVNKLIIIWESEFRNNPQNTVEKILREIENGN
jgi:very-short-patch-repair endonuclease